MVQRVLSLVEEMEEQTSEMKRELEDKSKVRGIAPRREKALPSWGAPEPTNVAVPTN